jgi:hypothetical protein
MVTLISATLRAAVIPHCNRCGVLEIYGISAVSQKRNILRASRNSNLKFPFERLRVRRGLRACGGEPKRFSNFSCPRSSSKDRVGKVMGRFPRKIVAAVHNAMLVTSSEHRVVVRGTTGLERVLRAI